MGALGDLLCQAHGFLKEKPAEVAGGSDQVCSFSQHQAVLAPIKAATAGESPNLSTPTGARNGRISPHSLQMT
jgi:hypothetical protein